MKSLKTLHDISSRAHAAITNARYCKRALDRDPPDLSTAKDHAILLRQQADQIIEAINALPASITHPRAPRSPDA